MLPRLVFADMDGTFLAADKSVPTRNMQLLDELAQRGVAFVPCTGRPISAIPPELMQHAATRYAVGSNGAVVYGVRQNAPIHVQTMDSTQVIALYNEVKDLNTTFDVFADGEVFSERARYDAMGSYGIDAPTLAMLRRVRKPVDLCVPQIVQRASAVEKITCFWASEKDRDALGEAIERFACFSSAHGHPKDFELQARGVSKGSALAWLCNYVGCSTRDTVAFGDEANDIPLLLAAGRGVAMANAAPEVLEVADDVALLNDDAGVAHYMEQLL